MANEEAFEGDLVFLGDIHGGLELWLGLHRLEIGGFNRSRDAFVPDFRLDTFQVEDEALEQPAGSRCSGKSSSGSASFGASSRRTEPSC